MMTGSNSSIIGALRNLNVLHGLSYTEGYINASGGISYRSATEQEVTSEFTANPLVNGEKYLAIQRFAGAIQTSNYQGWIGIGYWDDNDAFRTRSVFSHNNNLQMDGYWVSLFTPYTPTYTDGKVRFSFRTYGDTDVFIVPFAAFIETILRPNDISLNVKS